ncbi:hypothetical protein [Nocardioides sp. B-3]|uniref:hypothetical protein n=1 Tax=Nocardioides sp. B-3 TaxID=2895565 RepID=UPI00215308FA|nr:hypothetical protein [Nocardioides sp. B-3]UUZ61263.1 hypothetical protein LP418_12080 [Nocardioides sp. B-3]
MKWILAVAAVAVTPVLGTDALASRDENCPSAMTTGFSGLHDADAPMAGTALGALGLHLGGAEEITRDHNISKGIETVTFRGYDADGDLTGRVVVERVPGGWGEARVDTCDR